MEVAKEELEPRHIPPRKNNSFERYEKIKTKKLTSKYDNTNPFFGLGYP